MPAYGKERRIASSVKNSENSAGTDLIYDDLEVSKYSAKYTPEIIETSSIIIN